MQVFFQKLQLNLLAQRKAVKQKLAYAGAEAFLGGYLIDLKLPKHSSAAIL